MQGMHDYQSDRNSGVDEPDTQDYQRANHFERFSKCKIHSTEDIKAFCKDDLCSICFKCLLGEHRNHEIVMLDELSVSDLQEKVTQFQDKVEDQDITDKVFEKRPTEDLITDMLNQLVVDGNSDERHVAMR